MGCMVVGMNFPVYEERNCVKCGKYFQPRSFINIYCSSKCRPKKPRKHSKTQECIACGEHFVSCLPEKFCSHECRKSHEQKDYVNRWAERDGQELHEKRVKRNRRIQPMLNYAATEVKDPVSKRLKVMRG
jgi:hypothetical protein